MLGIFNKISSSVRQGFKRYVTDGLKLYMPYKQKTGLVRFVGTGSTSFDGVNDYITYSLTGMPTSGVVSFAMWVKPSDITANSIFLSYDNTLQYAFGLYSDDFVVGVTGTRSKVGNCIK